MFTSHISLWKYSSIGSVVLFGIALLSAAGRSGNVDTASAQRTLARDFNAPLPVRRIIQKACLDCHSEETAWPWYSNLPVISTQIHDEVNNAREFMNFSHWNEYTAEEQQTFASQIAYATNARIMPPSRYIWIHRDARLSAEDLDTLKEWARSRPPDGPPLH